MAYAAGVSGAKSSTMYPCGHMAYYDSGQHPSIICPICGVRHQNAAMMAPAAYQTVSASNTTNPNISMQIFAQQPGGTVRDDDGELEYPELAWLDREVSRYTKS